MPSLPLLDMAVWRSDPARFARELRHAVHNVGFFQVRHSRGSVCSAALAAAADFFELPVEQKLHIDYRRSAAFRGYMSCGVENTAGRPDLREQIELAAEAAAPPAGAFPLYLRLAGPNQWPEAAPHLRPTLLDFAESMQSLSRELTAAICRALMLPATQLDTLFELPHWQMKAIRYERADAAADDSAFGVGAHSDSGFLTLLVQDADGLQVFTDGEWVDVPPAGPDIVVCNLGEVAEMVSGGYLLATPHRVLPRERLSLPFFYNPSLDATVVPLALPPGLPRERGQQEQRAWQVAANKLVQQYGMNAFKSLARSHPEVMAAHHADLQVHEDGTITRKAESA